MPYWRGRGFGLNLAVVTDPAQSRQLYGPGGLGAFSWPGPMGRGGSPTPRPTLIIMYLIQNMPDLSADSAAAIAGNTSLAKLQAGSTEIRPADLSGTRPNLKPTSQPTVLISGAGIAVTTLAFWLTRNGYRVIVVEVAPGVRPGGQTVDLRGAGRDVVARMGLLDTMLALTLDQAGAAWVKADGTRRAEMPVTAFDGNGLVSTVEILRGDIADVLYAATREHAEFRFDTRITELAQDEDVVHATLSDGSTVDRRSRRRRRTVRTRRCAGWCGDRGAVRQNPSADTTRGSPRRTQSVWTSGF